MNLHQEDTIETATGETATGDPAALDAVEEGEDIEPEEEPEGSEDATPNNDFCFTNDDFIEYRTGINDATRHQGKYREAWDRIKSLQGHEEICNSSDGKVVWTVVDKVVDDDFETIRAYEDKIFEDKDYSPVIDPVILKSLDFSKSFWYLWPTEIDDDVSNINIAIVKENHNRKERYQRCIRKITKSEYVIFTGLMIGAAVHIDNGEKLWDTASKKKQKKSLSQNIDYGNYMKLWRFKEIKSFVPEIMVDAERKERDDWWRFSAQVEKYGQRRKDRVLASHVLVFDESMSAFVPR